MTTTRGAQYKLGTDEVQARKAFYKLMAQDAPAHSRLPGGTEIEVRPVFEAADFGDALTPELRENEERLRARSAARKA
jgi:hypothetical protein